MTEGRGPLGRGLDRIVGTVAPSVIDAVDVDAVLEQIDLDEVMARVDLDALLAKVDLDALLARIDVDALVGRIDVGAIVGQVDVDALVQRVDVDALVQRVDVAGLIERVDVNGLVGRIDLDPLLASVELDPLLAKVDVAALAERADIGTLVAQSSQKVAGSALDLARRQVVGLDLIVGRPLERLGRGPRQPGPSTLVVAPGADSDQDTNPDPASDTDAAGESAAAGVARVSGRYAGPISRLAAFAIDAGIVSATFAFLVTAASYLVRLFTTAAADPTETRGIWWTIGLLGWWGTYLFVSMVITGRTPGKAIVGLQVVRRDGGPLRPVSAFLRVLALPFSFAFFGLGFVGLFIGGERRAFHDVVASSAVVYDWGDRPAEMPGPLARFIERRTDLPAGPALPATATDLI